MMVRVIFKMWMLWLFNFHFAVQTTTVIDSTTESQTTIVDSTTESQTTTEGQETTTESSKEETTTESSKEESTTLTEEHTSSTTTTKKPSKGNSSCPEVGEGQALFVCPTGFRRHPQDCQMFYQCTESPETSHLSIVTFNCPNGTIYDEEEVLCRDRKPEDDCPSKMNDTLRILFDLESNKSPAVS
jgi:hypothetical protein